jgi:hypothetical protein
VRPGVDRAGQAAVGHRVQHRVVAAPYLLGSLADRLGLTAAFAIEPVLIGLCLLLLVAGLRAARRVG